MFNATFNIISVISWRSVLLVEEIGEIHRPIASHWQIYHTILYRVHLAMSGFELTTLVVIDTDCISSCKSNYRTIPKIFIRSMTTMILKFICYPLINN